MNKFEKSAVLISIVVILISIIMLITNHIFASNGASRVPNQVEKNLNVIDITSILNENKSKVQKQYIYTDEQDIAFNTVHRDNNTMTKDEINVVQKGQKGKEQISIKKTYEGDTLIKQETIANNVIQAPVDEIIETGTLDIPIINAQDDINDQPISGSYTDRKASALSRLGFDMDLRQKSGLAFEDFKKIASNDINDKNHVIADNLETFYFTEQRYNINGIFLMAVAIHESGWGTSSIAQDKKNLFGYGAYDSDPYNSSFTFESYAEGIQVMARVFVKYYLNPQGTLIFDEQTAAGSFYNGPNLAGINTRYASDPQWAAKVFTIMQYLYGKL